MVEALKIHSILFEITDRMGLGKDMGLIIAILVFLILMTLDYTYVLLGIKVCLASSTGLGLFSGLLLHMAAAQVNLGDTPEVMHITRLLLCIVLLNTAMCVGYRVLKVKILDPIAEKNVQKEFEQLLREEGIDPDSPEAKELQSDLHWNCRDIVKIIKEIGTDVELDFDEEEDDDSCK